MHGCGGCASDLLGQGVEAADDILRSVYAIDILKALDPLKDKDFVTIVNVLARKLDRKTNPPSRLVVTKAIEMLDVDWVNITRAQQDRVVDAANKVLGGLVPARMQGVKILTVESRPYVKNVRASAIRKFNLGITTASPTTSAVAKSVTGTSANFITDATGNIVDDVSQWSRSTVAELLAEGVSSAEIASVLGSGIAAKTLGKSANYWRTVSTAFANRARVWGQLNAYSDALIGAYLWESVMDERTTDVCRMLDGKRFPVAGGIKRFQAGDKAVQANGPQGLRDTQPWVTRTRNEKGEQELVIRTSEGQTRIATVDESGLGEVDKVGAYSNTLSTQSLADLGLSAPPIHGLCRSTIVADI